MRFITIMNMGCRERAMCSTGTSSRRDVETVVNLSSYKLWINFWLVNMLIKPALEISRVVLFHSVSHKSPDRISAYQLFPFRTIVPCEFLGCEFLFSESSSDVYRERIDRSVYQSSNCCTDHRTYFNHLQSCSIQGEVCRGAAIRNFVSVQMNWWRYHSNLMLLDSFGVGIFK